MWKLSEVCLKKIRHGLAIDHWIPETSLCTGNGGQKQALVDYHCLIRVKAEMDQFRDGLTDIGITDFLKQYPDITRPLLTSTSHGQIDAGLVKGGRTWLRARTKGMQLS